MSMQETIKPTPERIRHAGDTYIPPAKDQRQARDYGRVAAWHELLERKGSITSEQAMAAREIDLYWHGTNDPTGCTASYGDQRWNGTPVGQMSLPALIGPEWRETCRAKLRAASNALTAPEWQVITLAIETNGSLIDIGRRLGYRSERTCRHRVGQDMRQGLQTLAILWRFARPYHDPPIAA